MSDSPYRKILDSKRRDQEVYIDRAGASQVVGTVSKTDSQGVWIDQGRTMRSAEERDTIFITYDSIRGVS